MRTFELSASLLSADFARLGEEANNVLSAGADMLHLDVMDNHYVPNLTIGPLVLKSLRNFGIQATVDVHLMTRPVDSLIIEFAKAGATSITFHPEASDHIDRSLSLIKEYGCLAGLALNPATPISCLDYILDKLDVILVMSVNPGFGGQAFIDSSYNKIQQLRHIIDEQNHPICLAIDGGVKLDNIAHIAKAGADRFIAGSAIFCHPPYQTTIAAMRKALTKIT